VPNEYKGRKQRMWSCTASRDAGTLWPYAYPRGGERPLVANWGLAPKTESRRCRSLSATLNILANVAPVNPVPSRIILTHLSHIHLPLEPWGEG